MNPSEYSLPKAPIIRPKPQAKPISANKGNRLDVKDAGASGDSGLEEI